MTKQPRIKLRGHHLVCLHFFAGEGYDARFVENLRKILEGAENREEIEVHTGPDDVCAMCPYIENSKCSHDKNAEDEIKEMDRLALQLLMLKPGDRIKWSGIRNRIPEMFGQWARKYCKVCSWKWACEKKEGFEKYLGLSDKEKKASK